jgi:xylulokinase
MLSAGESLNWLKRTLFDATSFKDMDELAAMSPKGSNGVVFLPYLFGERTPHNDPNARGMLFGLSGATQRGDIIRSVLEGVAFGIRNMYDCVEKFTPVTELTVTGGGAKSELWGQIIADVLNKPLRVNNVSEGPSLGAAFLAAVGSGVIGLEEIQDKTLSVARLVTPSDNAEVYDKYYEIYNRLYVANRDMFKLI